MRYHEGKITKIYRDASDILRYIISFTLNKLQHISVVRYDGEHTKTEADGKWTTYGAYQKQFTQLKLEQLRISPNAMDALMACKRAFDVNTLAV